MKGFYSPSFILLYITQTSIELTLTGTAVKKHLQSQIDCFINKGIKGELADLDPVHTFNQVHEVIRSIEEFINIPAHVLDLEDRNLLRSFSIVELTPFWANLLDRILLSHIGKDATDRFKWMVLNSHQLLHEFSLTGQDLGYRTILEATGFYQAHRRHLVNLLYVIPKYCKGSRRCSEADTLLVLIHFSECYLRNVTSLYRQLTLSYIHHDYEAVVNEHTIEGNYQFDVLEKFFTEPERVSITDPIMEQAFKLVPPTEFVTTDNSKVFSVAELMNACVLVGSYFTFFEHDDSVFEALKKLILDLTRFVKDDYFISVPESRFQAALSRLEINVRDRIASMLVQESDDFIVNSNSYHPFFLVGSSYKTNVNLLLRFVYYYKNSSLNNCKKFQIVSGFLFEDNVKTQLETLGFKILKDAKRIERQEFDVVTVRDNVIYNFQCKNNFIDISLMESNPKKFGAKNQHLINYYKKSIQKEEGREHLLKKKFNKKTVRHFVISRFPVVTTHPAIILFRNLTHLL